MLRLAERVSASLIDCKVAPWFPHLTDELVAPEWDKLACEIGVSLDNYGTAKIVCKNNSEALEIVTGVKVSGSVIPIQTVRRELIAPYCSSHIKFYSSQEI